MSKVQHIYNREADEVTTFEVYANDIHERTRQLADKVRLDMKKHGLQAYDNNF